MGTLSDGCLQAQAEYQNAELEIERTEAQVQDGYAKIQESTLKIEALRGQIQQAEEETAQLRAALAVCENEIQHGNQTLGSLQNQLKETTENTKYMESRMAAFTQQTVQLRQKHETLQLEAEQIEQNWQELEQCAAKRGEAYEQANAKLQQLYVRQSEVRVMHQTAAGQQEELRAQLAQHAIRQNALQQDADAQTAAYEAAKIQAAQAAQKLTEMQNQYAGFQKRYASAVEALEMGRKNREQAMFSLREKRQRQKLLQDMERNMEGFAGSVKAVLRADGGKPHGVCGTVAQLITTKQKIWRGVGDGVGRRNAESHRG